MTCIDQTITQVGSKETGATSYQNAFLFFSHDRCNPRDRWCTPSSRHDPLPDSPSHSVIVCQVRAKSAEVLQGSAQHPGQRLLHWRNLPVAYQSPQALVAAQQHLDFVGSDKSRIHRISS